MSTTNDERREVARRIRNNINEQADWVIPWAVFNDAAHHGDRETMERLADLIDPTCNMSVDEVTHRPTLNAMAVCVYECDRCHAVSYIGDVCCYPEPRYCPYCGARVVSDDGE